MKLSTLVGIAKEFDADTFYNVKRFGEHLVDRLPFERRRSAVSRVGGAAGYVLAGIAVGAVAVIVVNAVNPTLLRTATKTLRSAKDSAEDALASATHALREKTDSATKEKSPNGNRTATS
jgi:hypothetical protein